MTDTDPPITRKFDDTPEGVVAMLDANFDGDFTDCTFVRDEYVEGVWLLTNSHGGQCLAYLAGYPDPWGRAREHSDAEFTDEGWQR